ncbi:MAG: ammonium transporter [Nitrospinae bacterium]|nr:ammonium transporter [Nitrospinota bacterium]
MIDAGDTAWMLFATALVMLMTVGVSFYYAGMSRKKNVLAAIMHGFAPLCLVSVIWVLWGYTIAFGRDNGGIIGGLEWLALAGVGSAPSASAGTIPHLGFAAFQGMFAVVTTAIIAGAFAERMKFTAFLLFTALWVTFVYAPLAHWVWGKGGWIGGVLGALDFAGGTVVHISAGVAALVAAFLIGPRRGFGVSSMAPHNLVFTLIGAGLLWFGWFGFNAGSAFSAGNLAALAFINTNSAAAAAALAWIIIEWLQKGKPTFLGAASGALAGLVAITPACGFVGPLPAMIIGAAAAPLCYGAIMLKPRLGYDDSFDVFGVHAVCGTWGAMATGLFASTAVNPAGLNGFFSGNPPLLGIQAIAVIATYVYVALYTYIICKIVDRVVGLRVSEDDEITGLDYTQHRESAYNS